MIKTFKYLFYILILGEKPHFHEWSKWTMLGLSLQKRTCSVCGKTEYRCP